MNPNECSFCGRQKNETQILFSGMNGYICNHCIEQAHSMIESSTNQTKTSSHKDDDISELKKPREIKEF